MSNTEEVKTYMTVGEAGKRGGTVTKALYGREHYQRIGKIGGTKSRGGGRKKKEVPQEVNS